MHTHAKLNFIQAHLGMLFAASAEDTHARVGIGIAQEGVACLIFGYRPDDQRGYDLQRISLCTERLSNFNSSEESKLPQVEGDHLILPGATYEGALVYQAHATLLEESFGPTEVCELLRQIERFLLITARQLDARGDERVWRPHSGK